MDDSERRNVDAHKEFRAELGMAVMMWNTAENHIRHFLTRLLAFPDFDTTRSEIVFANASSRALCDILTTQANALPPQSIYYERLLSYARFYGVLTSFRNEYMHGISSIFADDGIAHGFSSSESAKGKFKWHRHEVSLDDMKLFVERCNQLGAAMFSLSLEMFSGEAGFSHEPLPVIKFNRPHRVVWEAMWPDSTR